MVVSLSLLVVLECGKNIDNYDDKMELFCYDGGGHDQCGAYKCDCGNNLILIMMYFYQEQVEDGGQLHDAVRCRCQLH